jgi:class 3 adenylate cyclase
MGTRQNDSTDLVRCASRLRFPDDVEKAFRDDYFRNSIVIARTAIILTIVLYGLFGILDIYAAPLSKHVIWGIRFTVVIPFLLCALLLSYRSFFCHVMQLILSLGALTVGFGILAMIAILSSGEPGYHLYYAGLMLVIVGTHTILRLRFVYATLSTILIVAGYELIGIVHQRLLASPDGVLFFISNNFFFISSNIIGMTASYFLEVYIRRDFAQRLRLAQEQEKAERLLLNILPREIAATLKDQERIIADHYPGASILFADVVDFTPMSASMMPAEIVGLLNEVFSQFDNLIEQYDLEKIKTIGDCYMVAAGVPRPRPDHAHALARMGLEILKYVEGRTFGNGKQVALRIGINSGPVVAGVIGRKKFIYDLWGDAVNVASRMESHGMGGTIQITTNTYELIKDDFVCEPHGTILVKGKGEMPVWRVVSEK